MINALKGLKVGAAVKGRYLAPVTCATSTTLEGENRTPQTDDIEYVDAVVAREADAKKEAEKKAIGGLRRTSVAISKVPGLEERGRRLGQELDVMFDTAPVIQNKILQAILTKSTQAPLDSSELHSIAHTTGGVRT